MPACCVTISAKASGRGAVGVSRLFFSDITSARSARIDSGHMPGEAPPAMLLRRVAYGPVKGPSALTAREVLEIATLGGAKVLDRDDIGALVPGMAADIVTIALDEIGLTGAHHDPLAGLMFCHVLRVKHSVVNYGSWCAMGTSLPWSCRA
jgi:cytosine/adenosine deaminase-related metal-dependent hydrolase